MKTKKSYSKPKKTKRPSRIKKIASSGDISLLEPIIREPVFDSFTDLAKSYDALINEYYRYYQETSSDEPNMFGFVTLRHSVQFTDKTDSVYTENIIGQKTNVIYAPLIKGETPEEQEKRRLGLLAMFDHTKRASHILSLTLLASLLRGPGLKKLTERYEKEKLKKTEKKNENR